MKKFFKKLVYSITVITLFIPFVVFCALGCLAWALFNLYDLMFDWAYE